MNTRSTAAKLEMESERGKKPGSPSKQGFTFMFVEEKGNGAHGSETKSRIKMHVMDRVVSQKQALKHRLPDEVKEYPKRELVLAQGQPQHVALADSHLLDVQIGKSKLVPFSGIQEMLRLAGTHIEVTPTTKFLLHHFLNHRSESLCTVTAETGWMKYAVRNQALFATTLWHWAFMNRQNVPERFKDQDLLLSLKGDAIFKVNSMLSTDMDQFTSDAAIAAVACLANANLILGDVAEAKVHVKGLHAMVRSRRGFHNLGFNGLIARILHWTDTCHSVLTKTELSLEEPEETLVYQPNPESTPFRLAGFKIISELREVAQELCETHRNKLPNERRVTLGRWLLKSNRELLKQIHAGSTISSVVASATFIFMQVVLRGMSRSSRMVTCLVRDFKISLMSALKSEFDVFAEDPASLCWALLVGILGSERGSSEQCWFTWCLSQACEQHDLITLEALTILMDAPPYNSPQPFLWILRPEVLEIHSVVTNISLV